MTLYLEKLGCNFHKYSILNEISDIGNHRVCTTDYTIPGKDGNTYFIEFMHWEVYKWRNTNLRTGKPLKHPVRELKKFAALYASLSHLDKNGDCWGNHKLFIDNTSLDENAIPYTAEGVLEFVNRISTNHYDRIEFVERS